MRRLSLAAAAFALSLAACATATGSGEGSSGNGDITATFTWKNQGANGGTMTAKLGTGQTFTGDYFQVTEDAQVERFASLWSGWEGHGHRYDGEWAFWAPGTNFVTKYTGLVLANLAGDSGTHMRCVFTLRSPSIGMSQGGLGHCQLPDGASIDAVFPASGHS